MVVVFDLGVARKRFRDLPRDRWVPLFGPKCGARVIPRMWHRHPLFSMPKCLALVPSIPQAAGASLIHSYSTPAAVACTCRAGTRLTRAASGSIKTVVTIPWAGTATGAACCLVVVGYRSVASASTDGNWHTLNDSTLAWSVAWEHAIVDREVAADHISPGSSSVLGQLVTLIIDVCRVFSVVDTNRTPVTVTGSVCLEKRVGPVSPLAKACNYR